MCEPRRGGKISIITWNGKLNLPLEEKMQLRKDYLKLKLIWKSERWEQKSSEVALHETHRELESQRLQLHQANQWADQAQREKISSCGELDMRNRLFNESRTRSCQEIQELRRICCEETDRAREESNDCESIVDSNSGFTE